MKTLHLTISIDGETLQLLKDLAKQKAQSVSAMIRLLVREDAEKGKRK